MTNHPHAAASLPPETLKRLQGAERTIVEGEHNGLQYKVSSAFNPDAPRYPNVGTHLWNAFPFLAIELEGYCDFGVQDPYTGRTMWVQYPKSDETTWYDRLRHLVDVMEATGFLSGPEHNG